MLHWIMALLILAMIALGFWMSAAIDDPKRQQLAFETFQLHKSVGLSLLILSFVRLGWRLSHSPPRSPVGIKPWERASAKLVHGLFYGLMIALPLSGWIYVSTGWSLRINGPFEIPTLWFGFFEWPKLPVVASLSDAWRASIAGQAMSAHVAMVWLTLMLFALHVGAALKHHFILRDATLAAMIPGLSAPLSSRVSTSATEELSE